MPGGKAGSEKSTVSGTRPTNRIRGFTNSPLLPRGVRRLRALGGAANSQPRQKLKGYHKRELPPQRTAFGRPASSLLGPQRRYGIDRHRLPRRNQASPCRDREQQQRHRPDGARIVRSHAKELAGDESAGEQRKGDSGGETDEDWRHPLA